ncbi:MAG: DUF1614 domain-containing protein [Candidatus Asgardarchaeia archaeon]
MNNQKIIRYFPISLQYFLSLLFSLFIIYPVILFWFEPVFVYFLGVSSTVASLILLLSILGSYVNIPLFEMVSYIPIVQEKVIRVYYVNWIIPELAYKPQKTVIAINLGGCVIPVIFSTYLVLTRLPLDQAPLISYVRLLIATLIVTVVVHSFAKPVKGIGIVMPGFISPLTTAITVAVLNMIPPYSNIFVIAYFAGTWGSLIGADLLNIKKIPQLGAPVASIGGAGTFDGIFLNGVMSLLFLILFI